MTESEWLRGENPAPLMDFIAHQVSARKVRLILTACCSRMLDGTPPERRLFRGYYAGSFHQLEHALATVERFADGLVGADELLAARRDAHDAEYVPASVDYGGETELFREVAAVEAAAADDPDPAWVILHCGRAIESRPVPVPNGGAARRAEEERWQAAIVREVVGNPFCRVILDRRWQSETAVTLAAGIYVEKAFDRLPILADALEEAGCDDADILSHCRNPGPHVRGCWVVDLILGKG